MRGKRKVYTTVGADSDDDDDLLGAPMLHNTASLASSGSGRRSTSPSQPNPFSNLTDIAKSGRTIEADDNLALFQPEFERRPKVAQVLGNLVHNNSIGAENPEEIISAERSMVALKRKSQEKMGTLIGVYLPTVQNVVGVMLFLRYTWLIGVAGVGQALAIVFISCSTTMLTAISMSAIATNGVVPAGGSYYMISRNLGPEFGTAVGGLFFLGTTFASALYVLGAIEILTTYIFPGMSAFGGNALADARLFGTILLGLLACLVFVGVKYVNRFASVCLGLVLLSIFCIFLGYFASPFGSQPDICLVDGLLVSSSYDGLCTANDSSKFSWQDNTTTYSRIKGIPGLGSGVFSENAGSHYLSDGDAAPGVKPPSGDFVTADISSSFTVLLAIFFPAVTGIMAGSNRSGDLKDPSKSIPTGTIAAITTTSLIYLLSVFFLGGAVEGVLLRDKFGDSVGGAMIIAEVAWPTPWIVILGSFFSCIGAGLQSLTGAPRLLQAIAHDNIIPILQPFEKANSNGEPVRALIVTVLIAECGVLIASLDYVAPIITMFFLMCYAFVNLACTLQSLLKSPSWRPTFHYYHWSTSALGALLCLILMLISSWIYAVCAIALAALIYYYVEYKGAAKEWGDGLRGLSMQAARYSLLRLEESPPHTKNWRPQVLVLAKVDNTTLDLEEQALVGFAGQLKGGKGLMMVGSVLVGDFVSRKDDVTKVQTNLRASLRQHQVQGFGQAIVARDLSDGLNFLIQGSGLGALKHNTVMIGWPEGWRERHSEKLFLDTIRTISAKQLALLVPKNLALFPPAELAPPERTIDVWWIVVDGGLELLISWLLKADKAWRRSKLRIFTVAESDDDSISLGSQLTAYTRLLRIDAEVAVIEMMDSDISAYTYQRTVAMEERQRLLRSLNLTKKELEREPQNIVDRAASPKKKSRALTRPGIDTDNDDDDDDVEVVVDRAAGAGDASPATSNSETAPGSGPHAQPSEANLRRMGTAVKLNQVIKRYSAAAGLVLVNMPGLPPATSAAAGAPASDEDVSYLEFIEELTLDLPPTLLLRGGGREVITTFS